METFLLSTGVIFLAAGVQGVGVAGVAGQVGHGRELGGVIAAGWNGNSMVLGMVASGDLATMPR